MIFREITIFNKPDWIFLFNTLRNKCSSLPTYLQSEKYLYQRTKGIQGKNSSLSHLKWKNHFKHEEENVTDVENTFLTAEAKCKSVLHTLAQKQ